jgi:succinate dehydrogenase / fumarate reductase cytochrome b subunit
VVITFSQLWLVIVYLIGLIALGFHLWHGFESGFQSLGLNHKKYTPLIKAVGRGLAILLPIAYAILPIYIFLTK